MRNASHDLQGPCRVYLSTHHDPWWNQAVEESLLQSLSFPISRSPSHGEFHQDAPQNGPFLFLWRNRPSVVIGRFQNPWSECHLPSMQRDGIPLIRRKSGGGTVFHDLGNLNFSFLTSSAHFDKKANLQLILDCLENWGIQGEMNERFDLLWQNKKISGSAFRQSKDRCLHHGTLLLSADLPHLKQYLRPCQSNLLSRAIPSVRSPVVNIGDNWDKTSSLIPQDLMEAIGQRFLQRFSPSPGPGAKSKIQMIDPSSFPLSEEEKKIQRHWAEWEWSLGETPPFQQLFQLQLPNDFAAGTTVGELQVRRGRIHRFTFAKTPFPEWKEVEAEMQGKPYGGHEVAAILQKYCHHSSAEQVDFLLRLAREMGIEGEGCEYSEVGKRKISGAIV